MKALIKYHASSYILSSKFVMPLVIYFLYLAVYYCTTPKEVLSSFVLSMSVLYIIMIWSSFVYSESEDIVSEQIIILKVGNVAKYYLSKIICMIIFGMMMSLVGILIPIIWDGILHASGTFLFGRIDEKTKEYAGGSLTFSAVVVAYLLHCVSAMLGSAVGFLFHPRIFKNRKISVVIALIVGVMGFLKGVITQDIPLAKLFVWLFPPIYDLIGVCENFSETAVSKFPPINDLMLPIGVICLYTFILTILSITTVKKIGF